MVGGAHGWFGPTLAEHNLKVIFAVPGIVLATLLLKSIVEARAAAAERAASLTREATP